MVKNTYGTGCFMLMHTGERPVDSRSRLLTTVAWLRRGRREFALEGSIFIAGAAVQWLRDGLGLIRSAEEVEALAASVPDNGGVYLVPAFTGLGAPHWDPYARGIIAGLTRGSHRGPPCARDAGGDRLPDRGHPVGHAGGLGHRAEGAAGGRRCHRATIC